MEIEYKPKNASLALPALARVAEVIWSPFTRPDVVNSVPVKTSVVPNGLNRKSAAMVSGAGVTESVPPTAMTR